MAQITNKFKKHGFKKAILIAVRKVLLGFFSLAQRVHPPYHLTRLFKGYSIKNINGFKMYLDLKNDVGISRDLFIFRKREHLSTDYMLAGNVLKPGDTVLDVGANIGYYALIESRLVGPSGKVFALEPVKNNYRMLEKNVSLNNLSNVRTFNLAAGSANEVGEIHVAAKGNISSFVFDEKAVYKNKESIELVKIDDFVEKHNIKPAFVRMDVQGFEKDIIRGMSKTLLSKPQIFIEVHPFLMTQDELVEMFKTIKDSGYTKAVVMKTRKAIWMKRNGEVRPILKYLSQKIDPTDYSAGIGNVEHTTIEELQKTLLERKAGFIVFLS